MKSTSYHFLLTVILVGLGVTLNEIAKLKKEVRFLASKQTTEVKLKQIEAKIDGVAVKLDSLVKQTTPKKKKKPLVIHLKKRVDKDSAEVSILEHTIYQNLVFEGMSHDMARIVVAIAKHESRGFNSGLFNSTNNLFGMTYPPRRETLATGHKTYLDNGNVRRFCTFSSVGESTRDMVLYLKHWGYPMDVSTPEEMVRIMKSKRYFEAPESLYLRAVKRHMKDLTI